MSGTTHTVIETRGLNLAIAGRQILVDVTFSVREAEYLSIIGPNGAGKTTLLKCLNRILKPTSGTVLVDGTPIETIPHRQLARRMSYVPQLRTAQFPFTVREFVAMGRYPHLSPFSSLAAEDHAVIDRALDMTATADIAPRSVTTLSGGEFQKVSIAAALAQEGEILLLDEPVTFLDPKYQNEINRLLKRLNVECGVTILSVSHDINSAVLHSDRILALRDGAVAFCGSVGDMAAEGVLEEIFDTVFLRVDHPKAGIPLIVPEEFYARS